MREVLAAIDRERKRLTDCALYRWMRDEHVDARQRMAFAPSVAFFSMSFGDLMATVLRRDNPQTDLDHLVNAHCAEDDYHWKWYLDDLETLGYDEQFTRLSDSCRLLWSKESAPVRHLIYSVLQYAGKSPDPLFHLILIEILEAGLSGFFEYSYRNIAERHIPRLKYFGETHYREEYDHSVTSWFQVDHDHAARHPLSQYTPTDEVRDLAAQAISTLFGDFGRMYDFWYEVAVQSSVSVAAEHEEQMA